MLIKKEKKGNINVYYVDKNMTDEKMERLANKQVKPDQIDLIIKDDADVYDSEDRLLLKFRKNKLSQKKNR